MVYFRKFGKKTELTEAEILTIKINLSKEIRFKNLTFLSQNYPSLIKSIMYLKAAVDAEEQQQRSMLSKISRFFFGVDTDTEFKALAKNYVKIVHKKASIKFNFLVDEDDTGFGYLFNTPSKVLIGKLDIKDFDDDELNTIKLFCKGVLKIFFNEKYIDLYKEIKETPKFKSLSKEERENINSVFLNIVSLKNVTLKDELVNNFLDVTLFNNKSTENKTGLDAEVFNGFYTSWSDTENVFQAYVLFISQLDSKILSDCIADALPISTDKVIFNFYSDSVPLNISAAEAQAIQVNGREEVKLFLTNYKISLIT